MTLISCMQDDAVASNSCVDGTEVEVQIGFKAGLEKTPRSKTVLTPDFKVRWELTDRISVFDGAGAQREFKVKSLSKDGQMAVFEGAIPQAERYHALYPAQQDCLCAGNEITATLPFVQHPETGSFDPIAALSVAEIAGTKVRFANVGAILGIRINNDNIKGVRIESVAGVPMTGDADITVSTDPFVRPVAKASSSVGLTGDFQKGSIYYAVVYPGNHDKGFSITFTDGTGRTATYTNPAPLNIPRNGNFNFINLTIDENRWVEPAPQKAVWKLVRNVADLKDGDQVRIGCPLQSVAAGPLVKNYLSSVSATYTGDEMESGSALEFTLQAGQKKDYWKLSFGGNLLTAVEVKSLSFTSGAGTGGSEWNISIAADGTATLGTASNGRFLYNVNHPRFLNYTSNPNKSMLLVHLYKKTGGTPTDPDPGTDPDPDTNPDPDPGTDPNPNPDAGAGPVLNKSGWLELPGVSSQDGYIGTYWDGRDRNYTYNYQRETFTSLWVAYPLYAACIGGSRKSNWQPAPDLPAGDQINIWKSSYGVDVGSDYYARGHQIPDADRSGKPVMQEQTYYAINSTPQIQNGFNAGLWKELETGIRNCLSGKDTTYVVTGASFKTVGGQEKVKMIKPRNDSKQCPVPNYYWKVILKVKRSGNTVTDASAIGFWLEHKVDKSDYSTYAVSVDEIEAKTGFDFFVNLPDGIESRVEKNTSWPSFQSY